MRALTVCNLSVVVFYTGSDYSSSFLVHTEESLVEMTVQEEGLSGLLLVFMPTGCFLLHTSSINFCRVAEKKPLQRNY